MRVTLAFAAGLAACHATGAPDDPPCATVALRYSIVTNGELAGARVDDPTRKAIAAHLPAMRAAIDRACTTGQWSRAVRNCVTRAADRVAFETCEQDFTPDQRREIEIAAHAQAVD